MVDVHHTLRIYRFCLELRDEILVGWTFTTHCGSIGSAWSLERKSLYGGRSPHTADL